MKRIVFLFTFIASCVSMYAQNFYTPDDIEAVWYQGSPESLVMGNSEFETLHAYVSPISGQHNSPMLNNYPPFVTVTLQKDNKFLCLTFAKLIYNNITTHCVDIHYIDQYDGNVYRHLDSLFPNIKDLLNKSSLDFNFTDIRYYKESNCVIIPCSYEYPDDNYLIIWLDKYSSVKATSENPYSDTIYYNTQGQITDPNREDSKILIRRTNKSSEKVIIR